MRIRISKLDKMFSLYIRSKANWTCEMCFKRYTPPTKSLHTSHFWGRRNKGVRFDPENVCALCFGCHQKVTENPAMHRDFFLKRLGERRYNALMLKANRATKIDTQLIEIWLKEELKEKTPHAKGISDGKRS